MSEDKFVMPPGARCDVPRCGRLATDALVVAALGHQYLCGEHYMAIRSGQMPITQVRRNHWEDEKRRKAKEAGESL